ncbi:MAG: hypothetical protein H7Y32_08455 [Chloroflexales bacterium]|nr:hypothetical protein [Chloroflexales bacterium]
MLAQNTTPAARSFALPDLLKRSWAFNPTMTIFTVMSALFLAVGVVGMIVDPRIVLGMPNWAKSTKFGISLLLYGATLLWLLPMITARPRLVQFVAHATGAILIFEIVLLVFQATRGVPMHFNVSTPLDATLWQAMSISIMAFWLVTALALGLLLFQKLPNRVLAWSVRLGLLLTLVGFTEGFLMPPPNATQRAALAAGQQLDLLGAHTVGAADGGPGLPLLGWSTNHGDLRIGHFIGIHGIQAIALLGALLLRRRPRWLNERHTLALVSIGAAAYGGLIALVTWQALRDQPLLAPDALTLGALGALIATTTALAGGVLLWARGRQTASNAA